MKNDYEAGIQKVIPAVLIYAFFKHKILMLYRDGKGSKGLQDHHLGKWNGLGGKSELGESPLETAKREFLEESGLDINEDRFELRGSLQFPNFKPHKSEDWWCSVFTLEFNEKEMRGLAKDYCNEGRLDWVDQDKVFDLNLWEGDRLFLPYVIQCQSFFGTIWYVDQKVERSWLQKL